MPKHKSILIITQKVDSTDSVLGFFHHWLEKFAEKFDTVTVFCQWEGEHDLPSNVSVSSLGKERGASKLRQLFTFYALVVAHRREYDAVFVHMNPVWVVVGWFAWKILGKYIALWYAHRSVTPKLRLATMLSDRIFTSTPEGFRLASERVSVVGQGIDTDMFAPRTDKKSTPLAILSVGRISPIKQYDVLVEAAKLLKNDAIDFTVTIVGAPGIERDRVYEEGLKKMVVDYGLEGSVDFTGAVNYEALPAYYQRHTLFINISKTGSLDKTILEAMACGCVVISSNESAVQFLPDDLIVNGNDPQELAHAIKTTNLDERPALREYVVDHHSLDALVENISKEVFSI